MRLLRLTFLGLFAFLLVGSGCANTHHSAHPGAGAFHGGVQRDESFGWRLPQGTYLVSRIVPWQTSGITTAEDPRKNINRLTGEAVLHRESESNAGRRHAPGRAS